MENIGGLSWDAKSEIRLEVKMDRSIDWWQMHLPQITWENHMEHLVCVEWQLEKWRYCWWLVGLM